MSALPTDVMQGVPSVNVWGAGGMNVLGRNRGVTLTEAILYLTIAAGVVVFSASVLEDQRNLQDNRLIAAELQAILDGTQLYVARDFDAIRRDLFASTASADPLAAEIPVGNVVAAGFLPVLFAAGTGALNSLYGQDYAILARGALRSAPADAVSKSSVEDGDGNLQAILVDGVFNLTAGNDELDLEVILVSSRTAAGATPIPPQEGSRIVELTGRLAAGYVGEPDLSPTTSARGAFGGWELTTLGLYGGGGAALPNAPPADGQVLAALVALPNSGAVSVVGTARDSESFARCAGVPETSAAFGDCLDAVTANRLYSSVVFNTYDADGDTLLDTVPGIIGVGEIAFANPLDTNGDGVLDAAFASMAGLNQLEMTSYDTNGDGILDRLSSVSGLSGVSCASAAVTASAPQRLRLECPEVEVSALLTVGAGLNVTGTSVLADTTVSTLAVTGTAKVGTDLEVGNVLRAKDIVYRSTNGTWNFNTPNAVTLPQPPCPAGSTPSYAVSITGFDVRPRSLLQLEPVITGNVLDITARCSGGGGGLCTGGSADYFVQAYCQ